MNRRNTNTTIIWGILFFITVLMIFFQSLKGLYSSNWYKAWIWLAIAYLPLFIYLKKNNSKIKIYSTLKIFIYFYLVTILSILLLRPLISMYRNNPLDFMFLSLLILCIELLIMHFSLRHIKENNIQSSPERISFNQNDIKKVKKFLEKSEIKEGIQFLKIKFSDNRELIQIEGRYSQLESDNRRGTIDREGYYLENNRIRDALFSLLEPYQ